MPHLDAQLRQAFFFHQKGEFAQAKALYEEVLKVRPQHPDSLHLLGLVAYQTGQSERAAELMGQAIELEPRNAAFHYNFANALVALGQLERAVDGFDRAIALKPDYAKAYCNRGSAFLQLKQPQPAAASFSNAIELKPDYAEAHCNRSIALLQLGQPHAALANSEAAIALKADYAEAWWARGAALQKAVSPEAALASYDKAIGLKPDLALAHLDRGIALQEMLRLEDALSEYDTAIRLQPEYIEAYWNKGLALLLSGDFRQGWELYEWRWKLAKFTLQYPRAMLWDGRKPLQDKTILLYGEQGLGDTLQFCRFVKQVANLGARVILQVSASLFDLFQGLEGVSQLVRDDGELLSAFDFHCPVMSLPRLLGIELNAIPSPRGYLRSNEEKRSLWSRRLGSKDKPRVGIVWSGSTGHENDHNRSVRLSTFVEQLPHQFQYVSLQKEVREVDRTTLGSMSGILDLTNEIGDFSDTAAICDLMDVVVSVDTSVAHLNAALGNPTWVVLPHSPDWRWLLDRSDSPWYPSARLYRQPVRNDWPSVFARVAADLEIYLRP